MISTVEPLRTVTWSTGAYAWPRTRVHVPRTGSSLTVCGRDIGPRAEIEVTTRIEDVTCRHCRRIVENET